MTRSLILLLFLVPMGAYASLDHVQGKWVLISINHKLVNDSGEMYFELNGDLLSGFDGCNSFGGEIDNPDSFRVTQRYCDDLSIEFPIALDFAKDQLFESIVQGNELTVPTHKYSGTAIFRRQAN